MKKPGNRLPDGTKTPANPVPANPTVLPGEPDSDGGDNKDRVDIPDYAIVFNSLGGKTGANDYEDSADLNRDDTADIVEFGIFVNKNDEEGST